MGEGYFNEDFEMKGIIIKKGRGVLLGWLVFRNKIYKIGKG